MKSRVDGFTLVEVLVVIAIIAVLAGLVTVSVQKARSFFHRKATRAEILQLIQAANNYKTEFGDHPPTFLLEKTNGLNEGNESLLLHLFTRQRGGPFMEEIPPERLENLDGDRLAGAELAAIRKRVNPLWETPDLLEYCDYWGNPFVYIHHRDYRSRRKLGYQGIDGSRQQVIPAKSAKTGVHHGATSFQIWSFGPNGINENGQGDDIPSWSD